MGLFALVNEYVNLLVLYQKLENSKNVDKNELSNCQNEKNIAHHRYITKLYSSSIDEVDEFKKLLYKKVKDLYHKLSFLVSQQEKNYHKFMMGKMSEKELDSISNSIDEVMNLLRKYENISIGIMELDKSKTRTR